MKHILNINNYKTDLFQVTYKDNYFDDFILYNKEEIKIGYTVEIGHNEYLSSLVDAILKSNTEYMILNNVKNVTVSIQLFNKKYNNFDTLDNKDNFDEIFTTTYAKNHYVTLKYDVIEYK